MKESRLILVAAALIAASTGFASEEAAIPAAAAAPVSIGAMADGVKGFFRAPDPNPGQLAGIVSSLNRIGQPGGPTRDEMAPVILSVQMAADRFSPMMRPESKPSYGTGSAAKLDVLAGPLKAWLTSDQKEFIPQARAEYSAKLTTEDRQRLTAKMDAMAEALGKTAQDDAVPLAMGMTAPAQSRLASSPKGSQAVRAPMTVKAVRAQAAAKPDTWVTHLLWALAAFGTAVSVPLLLWLRVYFA